MTNQVIHELRLLLERVINKYNSLTAYPMDFGVSERLYPSELHFLEAVKENEPCTGQSLSALMGVTKGAVSQLVAKLEKKALISRERNKEYGKEILINLSEKGKTAVANHETLHQSMYENLALKLKGEPQQSLETVTRLLGIVETLLDECLIVADRAKGDYRKML